MNFHPDVLAAHAEFGGDLESMQKLYEYPALKAENERLRLSVSAWEDSARINKARADDAERALAERAGGVKVRELLDEGLEILNGIIDNVKRRGNYSPESTCVFIDQAGQCLREALSALTAAQEANR